MFVRVVRFTDVDAERVSALRQRIESNDGPPEGVISTGIQMVYDESAGTMVVIQKFDSRENMETSAKVLEAMDAGDTPGTRTSVDAGEVIIDLDA